MMQRPTTYLQRILLTTPLLLSSLSAHGLASDAGKPVHLHANTIFIDQTTGLSHYRGSVVLRQGSLRITADRAIAVRQGRRLENVRAYGSPATARQLLEEKPREIVIRGTSLVYDAGARRITVQGKVVVERGRDRVHADELSYALDSKTLRAEGKDGRQVAATLWREEDRQP